MLGLLRTWDTAPLEVADKLTARHRRVVNALAEHLKTLGHSDPDAKRTHEREKTRPPDLDADFAVKRVTLPSARIAPREQRVAKGGEPERVR